MPLVPVSTSPQFLLAWLSNPLLLHLIYPECPTICEKGHSSFVQILDLGRVGGLYSNTDISKWTRGFFAVLCPVTPTPARNPTTLERGT